MQVAIRPPRAAVLYKEREQCMDGTDLVENSQDSILMFKKAFVSFLFGQSKYSRGFLRADSSTTSPYRLARSENRRPLDQCHY